MLTKRQYKLLNAIDKSGGLISSDYAEKKELYDYLRHLNLIRKSVVDGFGGYVATEFGRAELQLYRESKYRFWLPTIISIIALLISAAAIVIPYTTKLLQ